MLFEHVYREQCTALFIIYCFIYGQRSLETWKPNNQVYGYSIRVVTLTMINEQG